MGEVTQCHLCGFGAGGFRTILDLGSQPLAERDDGQRYPLALAECGHCGLVQLSYAVDRREVFPPGHPYRTGATAANRRHAAELAAEAGALLEPGDLIIDIGANDGTLLAAVRRASPHARLLAIEPTGAVRYCREQAIPAEQEFWSPFLARNIVKYLGRAKVITACNVMAHADDPHGFTDAVLAALADDGILITENHDFASVASGLQIDTVYHEHLVYWTPATLGRLLEQHGLMITGTELIPAHGGSFRVYAVRRPGNLQARAETARDQLCHLLEIASEDGPVYGIGAATRATPLIHFAGLHKWVHVICEVPGHPKIGTMMPGTGIEVVDEARLTEDQPPHALLLCWHVAGSVVPRLRAAGYQGRFIVPLPQARIWHG